jgi:uncharacterized protein (DUF2344 family)
MKTTLKSKVDLMRFIQRLIRPSVHSLDVSNKDDKTELMKEFDRQIKKGPMTIIFVGP